MQMFADNSEFVTAFMDREICPQERASKGTNNISGFFAKLFPRRSKVVPDMTPVEDCVEQSSKDPINEETVSQNTTSLNTLNVNCVGKHEPVVDDKLQTFKASLGQVVEMLILKAVGKSSVNCANEDFKDIYDWLFAKIWAQVEEQDFHISARITKNMHSDIFKKLCKKSCCKERNVLKFLKDPAMDNIIVSCVEKHLRKSSRKSSIKKWFSSPLDKAKRKLFKVTDNNKSQDTVLVGAEEPSETPEVQQESSEVSEFGPDDKSSPSSEQEPTSTLEDTEITYVEYLVSAERLSEVLPEASFIPEELSTGEEFLFFKRKFCVPEESLVKDTSVEDFVPKEHLLEDISVEDLEF